MNVQRWFVPFFVWTLMIGSLATHVGGQEVNAARQQGSPQAQVNAHAYRLDYTLTESENGKKIDSRHYSINLGGDSQTQRSFGQVQIGTRVPIDSKADGTVQYIDVGTKITGSLYLRGGIEVLDTSCDVSSVVPDQGKTDRPVLRTLQINNDTPLMEGKSVLVGTVDDPNSNREFQLDVTVTELK